ncbi:hypothetical protein MTO96_029390 [Rhipicephalus appendiculatus]
MNATLHNMSGTGVMEVNYEREGEKPTHVYYTLDHWYPDEKCFILTRNINGHYACELHLWHDNRKGSHKKCDERYKYICQEGPTVFSEDKCM